MPRSTGDARPPDDQARSASNNQPPRPERRPAPDDDLTSLGDVDVTMLPGAGEGRHQSADRADDATSFELDSDATRYEPAADVTRFEPSAPADRPLTERRPVAPAASRTPTPQETATGGTTAEPPGSSGPLAIGQTFGPRSTITQARASAPGW